jgi:predicted nucleic acid-binding protein
VYLDTCYIAKFYCNEPDSLKVRELVRGADKILSSAWALAEFHAVLHRRMREGLTTSEEAADLAARFSAHTRDGLWNFIPVNEALLRRTSMLLISAPRDIFLRTADAVHLTTAQELGEREIWTSDRHILAAARYFGLTGRSV